MSKLALTSIRTDGGTQPRADISIEMVERYQEEIEAGAKFPPLVVFHDGTDHWLADGFHRYRALRAAKVTKAECEVRQGTQRDAVLYSVGANATHGLPRTNADKRRAVETLLRDEEWSKKSDRWIAERCAVSDRLVNGMRAEQPTANGSQLKREGKDGKKRKPPKPPAHPSEPLDVAQEAEAASAPAAVSSPPLAAIVAAPPELLPPPSIVRAIAAPKPETWNTSDEVRLITAALRPAESLAQEWPTGKPMRLLIDSLRALADRLESKEEEKSWQAN